MMLYLLPRPILSNQYKITYHFLKLFFSNFMGVYHFIQLNMFYFYIFIHLKDLTSFMKGNISLFLHLPVILWAVICSFNSMNVYYTQHSV